MRKARFAVVCAAALTVSVQADAQDYKMVVPQIAPATIDTYKALASAILEAAGAGVSFEVVPFARAMLLIENREVDALAFMVPNPDPGRAAAFKYGDFSTAAMVPLVFNLYTNKEKPIDVSELKAGNPRKLIVETDAAHLDYFPFNPERSSSIESSLRKLSAGRIDAYVFAQPSTDTELRRLELKNIRRQFYDFFTIKILLQKGARGGRLDQLITAGLAKIKASGKYAEIMNPYMERASKYIDWQP